MQSTDGQCTRILVGYSGIFATLIVLDKPNNPTTGETTPNFSAFVLERKRVKHRYKWHLSTGARVRAHELGQSMAV